MVATVARARMRCLLSSYAHAGERQAAPTACREPSSPTALMESESSFV
jgi:hypothetical protein